MTTTYIKDMLGYENKIRYVFRNKENIIPNTQGIEDLKTAREYNAEGKLVKIKY